MPLRGNPFGVLSPLPARYDGRLSPRHASEEQQYGHSAKRSDSLRGGGPACRFRPRHRAGRGRGLHHQARRGAAGQRPDGAGRRAHRGDRAVRGGRLQRSGRRQGLQGRVPASRHAGTVHRRGRCSQEPGGHRGRSGAGRRDLERCQPSDPDLRRGALEGHPDLVLLLVGELHRARRGGQDRGVLVPHLRHEPQPGRDGGSPHHQQGVREDRGDLRQYRLRGRSRQALRAGHSPSSAGRSPRWSPTTRASRATAPR